MKKLALLFASACLALTMSANAGPWEDMFPDHVAIEVSSNHTSYKEKNGTLQYQSSALLIYDIRGQIMDAGNDIKAIKKLLKSSLPGVCEIYYNPVSPTLDSNAELILMKKVKLKAMGLPSFKGKVGKVMGTWVKFKKTLPAHSGYFIANFVTDSPKFEGQTIQDDYNLANILY